MQRKDDPEALSDTDKTVGAEHETETTDATTAHADEQDAGPDRPAEEASETWQADDPWQAADAVEAAADEADAEARAEEAMAEMAEPDGERETDIDIVDVEPEPEPAMAAAEPVAPPKQAAPPPRRGGSGFVPFFLGGVVVAGLGFAAAHNEWVQQYIPLPAKAEAERAMAEMTARIDELSKKIDANASALDPLPDAVAAVKSAADAAGNSVASVQSDLSALSARVEALPEAGAAAGSDAVKALSDRLDRLEQAAVGGPGASEAALAAFREQADAAIADYESKLSTAADAAEARIAAAEAKADGLEAAAGNAARDLSAARVRTLAALGAPFKEALDELEAAGGAPAPDALKEVADTGIATLSELERSWSQAARDALSASLKAGLSDEAAITDRVAAFFRSNLGARSLEPHEGDDPDAVLSRAGAAVDRGDIGAALAELEALPAEGQAAMAGWLAEAKARVDALAALAGYGGDAAAQ